MYIYIHTCIHTYICMCSKYDCKLFSSLPVISPDYRTRLLFCCPVSTRQHTSAHVSKFFASEPSDNTRLAASSSPD